MQYPFAAHFEANGTAFQELIPIDSVLFSRECLARSFVSSSPICNECGNLQIIPLKPRRFPLFLKR